MAEPAIEINDIHKNFILPQHKNTSLKQAAVNIVRKNNKTVQKVLDGVSFTINKGDFFGIVGRNGSGKSTLLKLMAGVYSPTSGSIDVNGGLTPFIELGVGFNPELSGRDNVYLNGALLGFSRSEMDAMYEDIVDFAELGPFMDQKLKNYSSGMQVRLAFSIAVKAKNDILIFDEVLAVGDEAFQQKCMRIFEEYRRTGQTVVLVTHDMSTVRNLCTRAALIDRGKIVHIGAVEAVAERYSDLNTKKENAQERAIKELPAPPKSKLVVTTLMPKKVFYPSEELSLRITWKGNFEPDKHIVGVAIIDSDHRYLFGSNTRDMKLSRVDLTHTVQLDIGPGRYSAMAAILDKQGHMIDKKEEAFSFRVIDDGRQDVGGDVRLKYSYEVDKTTKLNRL